ncbi:MAG TPA: hypothetical protein VFK44_01110 [Bacillales bacterium]|nr:hypothetical protein [Bacillales bacterium]
MDANDKLFVTTKKLYEHLKKGMPKENREAFISGIDELLDERQKEIDRCSENPDSRLFEWKDELLAYDRAIQDQLGKMFQDIRDELVQVRRKKATSRRYSRPYEGGGADGMFLDQRK